jgi:hypothetical protein
VLLQPGRLLVVLTLYFFQLVEPKDMILDDFVLVIEFFLQLLQQDFLFLELIHEGIL